MLQHTSNPSGETTYIYTCVCSYDNLTGWVEGMHSSHTTQQLTTREGGARSVSQTVVQLHDHMPLAYIGGVGSIRMHT